MKVFKHILLTISALGFVANTSAQAPIFSMFDYSAKVGMSISKLSTTDSRLAFYIGGAAEYYLDEVLSVGDGAFREKSEKKMRSIITGGATTILVSHSIGQVRSMCNKILWLDHGRQIAFGDDVGGICDEYEKFLKTKELPSGLPGKMSYEN